MLCLFLDESSTFSSLRDNNEIVYVDDFSQITSFTAQKYDIVVFASGDFTPHIGDLVPVLGPQVKLFKPNDVEVPLERDFKMLHDVESFLEELSSTKVLMEQGLNFDEKLDLEGTKNFKLQGAIESVITEQSGESVSEENENEEDDGLNISLPSDGEMDEITSISLQMPDEEAEVIEENPDEISLEDADSGDISLSADGEDEAQNLEINADEIDLGDADSESFDLAGDDDIAELNASSEDDAGDVIEIEEDAISLDSGNENAAFEEQNSDLSEHTDSESIDETQADIHIAEEANVSDDGDEATLMTQVSKDLIVDESADLTGATAIEDSLGEEKVEQENEPVSLGESDDLSGMDDLDDLGGLDDLDDMGGLDDLDDMGGLDDLDDMDDMDDKTIVAQTSDFDEGTGKTVVGEMPSSFANDDDDLDATIIQSAPNMNDVEDETRTMISSAPEVPKANIPIADFSKSVEQVTNSLISSLDSNELLNLKVTLGELKEDRNNLLKRVEELEEINNNLKQETLNYKADNDELKIELSILRKRHIAENENMKHALAISEQKREILNTKLKNAVQEMGSSSKRNDMSDNQVRQRERELENQLELMAIDSDSKVKSRDTKILELKRKIDSLEFNMENMSIREKQSRKDKILLEDKLARVIDTLRSSLNVLEDDIDVNDIDHDLNV